MPSFSGPVAGTKVNFSLASQSVFVIAESLLQSGTPEILAGGGTVDNYANTYEYAQSSAALPDQNGAFVATNAAPATITGDGLPYLNYLGDNQGGRTFTYGVLAGQGATYDTGKSTVSVIFAGDNTGSLLVNDNAAGGLAGFTGAGANGLVGEGAINAFQTGAGGQDAVAFLGTAGNQLNTLTSQGRDTVSVYGSDATDADGNETGNQVNAITAVDSGRDDVTLNGGASLTFINLSTATSTITGMDGSTVTVGGTGRTLLVAGDGGNETFNVVTSAGNVTLVGGSGNETLNFVTANAAVRSGSVDVVTNFGGGDTVDLTGYGANGYVADTTSNPGSTTLTLADNTRIVFAGVTDADEVLSRVNAA